LPSHNKHGETYFVGYFADEEEAVRAYDAAILPLAGEFARLNCPGAATADSTTYTDREGP
jgi:hypothetical protein